MEISDPYGILRIMWTSIASRSKRSFVSYAWKCTYVTESAMIILCRWTYRLLLIGLSYVILQGNVDLVSYSYQYNCPIFLGCCLFWFMVSFCLCRPFICRWILDIMMKISGHTMHISIHIMILPLSSNNWVLSIHSCIWMDVNVYYWVIMFLLQSIYYIKMKCIIGMIWGLQYHNYGFYILVLNQLPKWPDSFFSCIQICPSSST